MGFELREANTLTLVRIKRLYSKRFVHSQSLMTNMRMLFRLHVSHITRRCQPGKHQTCRLSYKD